MHDAITQRVVVVNSFAFVPCRTKIQDPVNIPVLVYMLRRLSLSPQSLSSLTQVLASGPPVRHCFSVSPAMKAPYSSLETSRN